MALQFRADPSRDEVFPCSCSDGFALLIEIASKAPSCRHTSRDSHPKPRATPEMNPSASHQVSFSLNASRTSLPNSAGTWNSNSPPVTGCRKVKLAAWSINRLGAWTAVKTIAKNRKTTLRCVNPNLMGTSSERLRDDCKVRFLLRCLGSRAQEARLDLDHQVATPGRRSQPYRR